MKTLPFKSLQPTTYKSLGMRPAKKLTVLFNPCHDEQGRFCSTGGGSGTVSLSDIPRSVTGKVYLVNASDLKIDVYSDDTVRSYVEKIKQGKTLVPVFVNKDDPSWISDGNHRAAAYRQLDRPVPITPIDRSDMFQKMGTQNMSPMEYFKSIGGKINDLSPTTNALSLAPQKKTKPKPGAKPRLVKINGLLAHQASSRVDPTRTTGLRNRWAAEMGRRFTALRRLVWKAIVDDDCFGLGPAYKMYRPTTHSNPCHDEQGRFCSTGGGGGGSTVPKELNDKLRALTKADGLERAVIIEPSGRITEPVVGSEGSTDIGAHPLKYTLGSDLHVVHTHPIQDPLSNGDINAFDKQHGVSHISAILPNGEVQTATIIGDRRELSIRNDQLFLAVKTKAIDAHIEGRISSKEEYNDILRKGQYETLHQLDKEGFIKYVVIPATNPATHSLSTPTVHVKFDFPRLEDKIPAFMAWLQQQQDEGILELVTLPRMGQSLGEPWTNLFVKDSYERGVIRAREQLMTAGYGAPGLGAGELPLMGLPGMTSGVLANPFHVDRLASVFLRSYDGLKGISSAMDMQISHVLAQGLADGDNPITLAKKMNYVISGMGKDLGITDSLGRFIPAERRAKMLARTECIRAHAQAQLQEFKVWGVAGVDVVAEWVTAGFNVCPQCQDKSRQGPYTIEQAWNLIPFHPHCRCCWVAKPRNEIYVHSNPCHDAQGRFCSTGGGGGGGFLGTKEIQVSDFDSWEQGSTRKDYALAALIRSKDIRRGLSGIILKEGSEIKAIVSFKLNDVTPEYGKNLEIDRLATKESGYGTKTMQEICRIASSNNQGVILSADEHAVGFYEKLGMKKGGWNLFTFTKEQAKAFAEQKLKAYSKPPTLKELSELEPDDGIFTISNNTPAVHSNPCHDEQGRFCSTGGGAGASKLNIPKEPYKLPGDIHAKFAGQDIIIKTKIGAYEFEQKNVMNPSGNIALEHTTVMNGLEMTIGMSILRASYNDKKGWYITNIVVADQMKGTSASFVMLRMAISKIKEPLQTSGVFSTKGKRFSEILVKKGFADKINDGDDYSIHMGWKSIS